MSILSILFRSKVDALNLSCMTSGGYKFTDSVRLQERTHAIAIGQPDLQHFLLHSFLKTLGYICD